MLITESRSRERILLMGPWNGGKTYDWCNIAAWYRRTQTPGTFFILDTDNAVDRVGEEFGPEFYDNIDLTHGSEWSDYRNWMVDRIKSGGADDWLVVDMIDRGWDAVQNHFIETVWGKEPDLFMLEYRKNSQANPINEEGGWGINWQVINKMWYGWMNQMLQRWPGHVLCCTPTEKVQLPNSQGRGGDESEVVKLYGKLGYKPVGQKKLGHYFHTIILKSESNDGWVATTVKDRGGRVPIKGQKVENFALDYLVKVGGWQMSTPNIPEREE